MVGARALHCIGEARRLACALRSPCWQQNFLPRTPDVRIPYRNSPALLKQTVTHPRNLHLIHGCSAKALRPLPAALESSPSDFSTERRAAPGGVRRQAGKKRIRLDEACMQVHPGHSRSLLQSWIMQGKVLVDGQPVTKAGASVKPGASIEIIAKQPKFVCRAGYKLEGALDTFNVDVSDRVALDAGLSTGGFTDCLLQRGARRVYGVDVGYAQVHDRIRRDERVVVMERTNLRYLESLPEPVDLVTLDVSFISLLTVLPAVLGLTSPEGNIIALVKPQFEARRDQVGGGGIIRSAETRQEVVLRVLKGFQDLGLEFQALMCSPITGTDGNIEYLSWFRRVPNGLTEGLVFDGDTLPVSFFQSSTDAFVLRQGTTLVFDTASKPSVE